MPLSSNATKLLRMGDFRRFVSEKCADTKGFYFDNEEDVTLTA